MIYGLTGGVASGKSIAAQYFKSEGIPVLNADELNRKILSQNQAVQKAILSRFNTLDKQEIKKIIFQDLKAKSDLEKILHPIILEESNKIFEQHNAQNPNSPFIYEAPLLIETQRHKSLDGLIVVLCPEKIRVNRLTARDKISESLALQMIKAQCTDAERASNATWIVHNDKDINNFYQELKALLPKIIQHK